MRPRLTIRLGRVLRWLGVAAGSVGVGVLLLLTLDIGFLVRPLVLRGLWILLTPQSAAPHAEVQIDALHLHLLPRVRLVASGVHLGTLGTIESLRAETALSALLRPHPLRVDLLALQRPALHFTRGAPGSPADLSDLIKRLKRLRQPGHAEDPPGATLGRLEIDGGSLTVDDQGAGQGSGQGRGAAQHYEVTQIHVDAPLQGRGPQKVTVTAALFDPHPNLRLELDPRSGDLRLEQLDIAVADMTLRAHADLRGLRGAPQIHALHVEAQGAALERLLPLLPVALPRGLSLRGPARLLLRAAGDPSQPQVHGELDLSAAEVRLPEFDKAAGGRLLATVEAKLHAGQGGFEVALAPLEVALDALTLSVQGRVTSTGTAELTLGSTTGDVALLRRLLPALHRSLTGATGRLGLSGEVKRSTSALLANLCAHLSGADLARHGMRLTGDAQACVTLHRNGQQAPQVVIFADLAGAGLNSDGTPWLDKPVGQPLYLGARVALDSHRTQVQAALYLPSATVQAIASLAGEQLDISSLQLEQGAGHLSASVLRSLHDDFRLLPLPTGGGSLAGTASLTGWPPQKLSFDLSGEHLNMAEPDAPGAKLGAGGDPAPGWLPGLHGTGRLHLRDAHLGDVDLGDFQAEATLRRGVVVLKTLRAQLGQGSLDLGGTSFDLLQRPWRGNLQARFHRLDLRLLANHQTGPGPHIAAGLASGSVALEIAALPWEELAPRLQGSIKLDVSGLQLRHVVPHATLTNPVLQRAAARRPGEPAPRDVDLDTLRLSGRIAGGQLVLDEPLAINGSEVQGTLTGAIGLVGDLDLNGNLQLKPRAVATATQGKFVPVGQVPVRVHISGPRTAPRIEILDLGHTLGDLLWERLRSSFFRHR